jgi:hypothetical protein
MHGEDDADADGAAPQPRVTGWRRLVLLGQHRHHPAELPARGPDRSKVPPSVAPPSRPAPAPKPSRKVTLKASIAELLLVSKLRARSLLGRHPSLPAEAEKDLEAERKAVLTRYANILAVTCKNWFAEDEPRNQQSPSPHHQRHL